MPKRAKRAKPVAALSGHAVIEALKDLHFKRELRRKMQFETNQRNNRMREERYDDIRRGLSPAMQQQFTTYARNLI
jgi:hypothetical protein